MTSRSCGARSTTTPDVADARRERPEPRCVDLEDAPQLAGVEPPPQLADGGVEALDVADAQHPVRSAAAAIISSASVARCGDRLLDQHVGAGAQGGKRDRQMEARRRDDADEVEPLLREHPLRVLVAARAPARGRAATAVASGSATATSSTPSTDSSQTRTWLRPIIPRPTTPARSGRAAASLIGRPPRSERTELGGDPVDRVDHGAHLVVAERRMDRDAEHLRGEPLGDRQRCSP